MSAHQLLAVESPAPINRPWRPRGRHLRRTDVKWAIAFALPYAAVLLAFMVYPLGYALWMARSPSLYADLIADRNYPIAVVNTLVFVGVGVNLMMLLALLLSGFFLRPRWWIRALLGIFVLPWAIATVQACVSFHWMLVTEQGLVDGLLAALFGIDGPLWLNSRWLAVGSNTVVYIWKWLPFWTLIFLAGRLTIPAEIYDAAEVDGATGVRRFVHVTVPFLANLYSVCTLVAVLWALGDFTTVFLVSGGGPVGQSEVLTTLGYRYAFGLANPALGIAAVITAMPVLVPLAVMLLRRARRGAVQL